MTQATETSDAVAARRIGRDRPPVGLFLVLFAGMLALALGLAALSASASGTDFNASAASQTQTK